jgi:hypothetical protein
MVAVTYGAARTAAGALKAKTKTRTKKKAPSFFSRLLTAMMDARLRQAYRELELHRHLIPNDHELRGR